MDVVLVEQVKEVNEGWFFDKFKGPPTLQDVIAFNGNFSKCSFHVISDMPKDIKGAEVHSVADYEKDALIFDKHFINLGSLPKELTRRFIRRWIILNNFVKKNNLSRVLALDNDILLCSDPYGWPTEVTESDYCLSEKHSGQNNLINNTVVLEYFCELILKTYKDKGKEFDHVQGIGDYYNNESLLGGVCDMSFWSYLSHYKAELKCCNDTSIIFNNEETFDHSIQQSNGYVIASTGVKKIRKINNSFYGKKEETDRLIKFNTLHFQGGSKDGLLSFIKNEET